MRGTSLSQLAPRREILYLMRALAEACVLTPWLTAFALFYRPVDMLPVASAAFVVILGVSYLARGMEALHVRARRRRAIAAGVMAAVSLWALHSLALLPSRWPGWRALFSALESFVSLSTLVPPGLMVVMVVLVVWWRGLQLANKPLSALDASISFQIGVALFAAFLIISSPQAQAQVNPYIVAFFFCQLLAIGLTRVETIGAQSGGRRSPFGGWWIAALTISTSAVMLMAGVIIGIVTGAGPEYILRLAMPVLAIVLIPLSLVIIPFLMLFGGIIEALSQAMLSLVQTLGEIIARLQALANMSPSAAQPAPRPLIIDIALRAAGASKGALVVILTLLIIAGVLWATGRIRPRRSGDEDEERESIWSAGGWMARLRGRLEQQFKRIANATDILNRFGVSGLFTALTIRRIYAQLQQLAARRGYPRPPALTPYEYTAVLRECFSGYQADLEHITESFVGIRYGELPETPQELADIRAAWERIRNSHAGSALV